MEFIQVTFSRHGTCKLLCDTSLALARSSPTKRYTGFRHLTVKLMANIGFEAKFGQFSIDWELF